MYEQREREKEKLTLQIQILNYFKSLKASILYLEYFVRQNP